MWQCQGDGLCEQYCNLTTGLVETTKIEFSLAIGHLQDGFRLYFPKSNVGKLRTFHPVYFHCYFLHEDYRTM